MVGITIHQMKVGDSAQISQTITDDLICRFSEVTGDRNPVHIDEEFAKQSVFGARIAHGMLGAGLISNVIGTKLPGPGTIYMGQELSFRKPVYIGDVITATCTIVECNMEKNRVVIETVVKNQNEEIVITGIAKVMPPLTEINYVSVHE